MSPGAVIEALHAYANQTHSASKNAGSMYMRAQLRKHHQVLADAVAMLERLRDENTQLRERLVRQACWFEQFEARAQPKTWPLLEDDDEDCDPGAAL